MVAFFESKKAAAILKHAILNQYIEPFTMKAGKYSAGNRVAFIDGYAGEGRYEDNQEGSPALVLSKARRIQAQRNLECYFVEHDAATLEKLRSVIASEGQGLVVETFLGDIQEHLDTLLTRTATTPMFVFLDPFGLMIPFESAARIFDRPRYAGAPATELLINFNANAIRRIAGHLTSENSNEATLIRMDEVCGGDWWRKTWLDALPDRDAAEEAVVNGYASRLAKACNAGCWTTDVRNREDLKPAYHLVFVTRHQDGMYLFGESISLGLESWRKAIALKDNGSDMLFDPVELFKASEERLAERWITEIEKNLTQLLAAGQPFQILDRYNEVFGSTLAKAREKHLRAAWRRVKAAGLTDTPSTGKLLFKTIAPR
ncbi:three-Cys-motif partner protein TcmP [Micromonospora endophytica]|uniref:three-Cys-motif partner protein TcmP n=1 Tax=Micromonospora endophytica TaxID=515350 RepID=UPI0015E8E0B3|nr:three-Cys-motif partner protein TcmP [Micromonospora endophytica]BCJ59734.1 hypothetical protein Jiend_31560 [Micromonospora endophytica]